MEELKNENTSLNSTDELREWETPQLFIEDMENITEGGANPRGFDDGFYGS
jgi:hypothetical protein